PRACGGYGGHFGAPHVTSRALVAPRDLRVLLARLAEPDGGRLLAAGHPLAAAPTLERAALAPPHRRLDHRARALAVPRHLRHLLMRVFPVDASREYCKPCAHGWRRGKVSALRTSASDWTPSTGRPSGAR